MQESSSDDPVAVAHRCKDGVTIKQIAKDFGIWQASLQTWLRKDEIAAGHRPGTTAAELAELRDLRDLRKRNRFLEQENEVLRRAAAYLSQADLPGKDSMRS